VQRENKIVVKRGFVSRNNHFHRNNLGLDNFGTDASESKSIGRSEGERSWSTGVSISTEQSFDFTVPVGAPCAGDRDFLVIRASKATAWDRTCARLPLPA